MSLEYRELKPGKCIVIDGEPYMVTESIFSRVQQMKPTMQTKLKSLISGKVVSRGFKETDKIEEAEMSYKPIKYLYTNKGESWFCEEKDPSKRFKLEEAVVSDYIDLIKTNSIVNAMVFTIDDEEKIIGLKPEAKVDLKVVEAPPSIKGNTAQGGSKMVKVETGAMINTPLFIDVGDIIRVNTQTREYSERVSKAS